MEVLKQIKEGQKTYKLERLLKYDNKTKVYFSPPNYSIKQITLTEYYKEASKEELAILQKVKQHKNIVHLQASFELDNKLYIVRRYQQTDLWSYLDTFYQNKKRKFEEQDLIKIFKQIIQGFQYLHFMNIFHRNIKQENILINSNGEAVITGFGSSLLTNQKIFLNDIGTSFYSSPQINLGQPHTSKADIWSMGIMYFKILKWIKQDKQKYQPLETKDELNAISKIMPPNVSSFSQYLFKAMLQQNQVDRINWDHLFDYVLGRKTKSMIQTQRAQNRKRIQREIQKRMNVFQKMKSKIRKGCVSSIKKNK